MVAGERIYLQDHYLMRELVYGSEGKLQQFMIGKFSAWRNSVHVEGDVKIPGIDGVKVRPADPSQDKRTGVDLHRVLADLESSSRAARWFGDEESQPRSGCTLRRRWDIPPSVAPLYS